MRVATLPRGAIHVAAVLVAAVLVTAGLWTLPAAAQGGNQLSLDVLFSIAPEGGTSLVIDIAASGDIVAELPTFEEFVANSDAALLAVGGPLDDQDYYSGPTGQFDYDDGHYVAFPYLAPEQVVGLVRQFDTVAALLPDFEMVSAGQELYRFEADIASVEEMLGATPDFFVNMRVGVEAQDGDVVSALNGTDETDGVHEWHARPSDSTRMEALVAYTDAALAAYQEAPPAAQPGPAAPEDGVEPAAVVPEQDGAAQPTGLQPGTAPVPDGGLPVWVWAVGGLLVLVIAALVVALATRGGRNRGSQGGRPDGYGGPAGMPAPYSQQAWQPGSPVGYHAAPPPQTPPAAPPVQAPTVSQGPPAGWH